MAQKVKNLPAMCETWVQSLGWKDPLEEGMATHSSIFPGEFPWTEEPGSPPGRQKSDMTERLSRFFGGSHHDGSPGSVSVPHLAKYKSISCLIVDWFLCDLC